MFDAREGNLLFSKTFILRERILTNTAKWRQNKVNEIYIMQKEVNLMKYIIKKIKQEENVKDIDAEYEKNKRK